MDRLIRGLLLPCLFSLFFLALLIEILYVLLSSRYSQNDVVQQPSIAKRIRFKLRQSQGRAELPRSPASQSTPIPSVEDLMMMHAYSGLLFPIQEETDMDNSSERSSSPSRLQPMFNSGESFAGIIDSMEVLRAKAMKNNIYSDETPFQTPCDSPVTYYTPTASPHG